MAAVYMLYVCMHDVTAPNSSVTADSVVYKASGNFLYWESRSDVQCIPFYLQLLADR